MATAAKVGARNDLYALKEARRLHGDAASKVESAIGEVQRMREALGRPDYSRISSILAALAIDVSKQGRHLDDMNTLRELAKQGDNPQIEDRIGFLESRVEALSRQLNELRMVAS